jgi:hypothetical protein
MNYNSPDAALPRSAACKLAGKIVNRGQNFVFSVKGDVPDIQQKHQE